MHCSLSLSIALSLSAVLALEVVILVTAARGSVAQQLLLATMMQAMHIRIEALIMQPLVPALATLSLMLMMMLLLTTMMGMRAGVAMDMAMMCCGRSAGDKMRRTQLTRWPAMRGWRHRIIETRTGMISHRGGSLIALREQRELLMSRAERLQAMQQIRLGQIPQMQGASHRGAEGLQMRQTLIGIRELRAQAAHIVAQGLRRERKKD